MELRRYLPKRLFGRTLLILAAPVVALQTVVAVLILNRYVDGVSRQMTGAIAAELNYVIDRVEAAPDAAEAQADLAGLGGALGMTLTLDPGAEVGPAILRRFYDVAGGAVEETLKAAVRRPLALDLRGPEGIVEARIQTDKGVLRALVVRSRLSASNPHQLFLWIAASTALLVGVAVLFLRNQVRPIRELAAAADAFGKGRALPYRPRGADEVRRAGAAFIAMRARIERQIDSRTRMLSGVSHDLRSPLTRMRLSLAMMEDSEETEGLRRDVAQMERMIEAFLDFARGEGAEEAAPTDPAALAAMAVEAARRRGADVELRVDVATPNAPTVPLRAEAMGRALANLLDNAHAYAGRARLDVRLGPRMLEFVVEDDGPGIAPADREAALRPFTRLDAARNQDSGGGVGLGQSIAAVISRAHGGALTLESGEALGGLRARIRAPR